ncbi:MAG: hypothetical protein JWO87_421 [Phycisphaerales bacterium]|nr:hypothetical protein [Phycisphaerales bacterium]
MIRRLFAFASMLSLLLFMATAVLWVRSYSIQDQFVWQRPDARRALRSAPGHAVVNLDLANWSGGGKDSYGIKYQSGPPTPAADDLLRMYTLSIGPSDTILHWQWGGITWWRWQAPYGSSIAILIVPLRAVAAITAVLPLGWLTGRYRARRRRQRVGLCPSCGYDLRATPNRCPECGAMPANVSA